MDVQRPMQITIQNLLNYIEIHSLPPETEISINHQPCTGIGQDKIGLYLMNQKVVAQTPTSTRSS